MHVYFSDGEDYSKSHIAWVYIMYGISSFYRQSVLVKPSIILKLQ
jgi:hypothetical protein